MPTYYVYRCACGEEAKQHRMGSDGGGCTRAGCDCTLAAPEVRWKAADAVMRWAWLLANEEEGRRYAAKIGPPVWNEVKKSKGLVEFPPPITADDEPSEGAAPADLAQALVDTLRLLGGAADDASCHVGITTRAKCCRCKVIDEATALTARVPKSWGVK